MPRAIDYPTITTANLDHWVLIYNETSPGVFTTSKLSSATLLALIKHGGNRVFVSKDGNDSTGAREHIDKPFLTVEAAQAAATSGDTVTVAPGDYTEAPMILKTGVNFDFIGYGIVRQSGAQTLAIFRDNNVASANTIIAPGWRFIGDAKVIYLQNASSNLKWESQTAWSTSGEAISIVNATATLKIARCWSVGHIALYVDSGATVTVDIDECWSEDDNNPAVEFDGGSLRGRIGRLYQSYTGANGISALFGTVNSSSTLHLTGDFMDSWGWTVWLSGASDRMFLDYKEIHGSDDCTVVSGTTNLTVRGARIHNYFGGTIDGICHGESGKLTLDGCKITRVVSSGYDIKTSQVGGLVDVKGCAYDGKKTNPTTGAITHIDGSPMRGAGSPDGVVSAPVGTSYLNTSGGTSTTLYLRESATATQWRAV